MRFVCDDGGRAAAGFKGPARDCACRAIAIATGMRYMEAYHLIREFARRERPSTNKCKSSPRTGVRNDTFRKIMESLGWTWTPTMSVGSGCTVHLNEKELPSGRVIASVSKHYTTVIDGILHDTFDCSRGGDRCVYGFFTKGR